MPNSQTNKKKSERTYKLSERVTTPSLDLYHKYKENKYVQYASLFVRTYASTEEVERLLDVLNPDEYAYIVHDKDLNKDGTPKQLHIHLLVYKRNMLHITKFFKFTDQATRIEIPRSKKYAYEYLTHKNDPDKVAYSPAEIHEFHKGINTFAVTAQEARENRNIDLLDDISNLSRRQMAEKYGSDYIKNYRRYEEFMQVVQRDEEQQKCSELVCKLNEEATPTEEFYHLSSQSGDDIVLSVQDHFCCLMRDMFEEKGFLQPNELVSMYYDVLRQYVAWKRSKKAVYDL